MESNVYEAPESELIEEQLEAEYDLASRWSRLFASILDGIIMLMILVPTMFIVGYFEVIASGEDVFLYQVLLGIFSIFIFIVINLKFLADKGQTIGKMVLGIKIVDMQGGKAELKDHLFKRYLTYFLPGQVPLIGGLFSLINVLFIFRKDKRCIHDLVGNTQVIRV